MEGGAGRTSTLESSDDVDLVALARQGAERALHVLLERYRGFTRAKARSYFLAGSDRDDVVQEGMIGLYKAIRDYDFAQNTPFRAFAELCISRQILTAVKTANRNKHHPLNRSLSLDAPPPGDDVSLTIADTLLDPSHDADPAEVLITAEDAEGIRRSLEENLTDLEGEVLRLYMEGKSYEEIATVLGSHTKSIDNALQRIKRKLQRHLSRRDELANA